MSLPQARVITLKSTVKKIVQAILSGNTHIGSSDVGPLVEFCDVVGVMAPPSLKQDPMRPNQYLVRPVAELIEKIGPSVGIHFKMKNVPDPEGEEAGVVKALAELNKPQQQEAPQPAEMPKSDRPDLDSMSEAQLLLICKTLGIVRNQNGSRVSKAMHMDELRELVNMHHNRSLPEASYAVTEAELEPKTREQAPPSRVALMNMTQLRAALDDLGVKHTTAMTKPTLVKLVEAQHDASADVEENEAVAIAEDDA